MHRFHEPYHGIGLKNDRKLTQKTTFFSGEKSMETTLEMSMRVGISLKLGICLGHLQRWLGHPGASMGIPNWRVAHTTVIIFSSSFQTCHADVASSSSKMRGLNGDMFGQDQG